MKPRVGGGGPAALAAAALVALLGAPARGGAPAKGIEYVLISQPKQKQIVCVTIDLFQRGTGEKEEPLVTAGLMEPYGLAVDHNRQRLFVADPASQAIFMYNLVFQNGVVHTDGTQYVAMSDISSRWVTVDDAGNVYATDEQDSVVKKVSFESLKTSDATPTTLYQGSSLPSLSTPGGIWADGSNVFWGNKEGGTTKGSVVRGMEVPDADDLAGGVQMLANNVNKVYGVCASQSNVFYTGDEKFVYGVKKTNSDPAAAIAVSDVLIKPRGCTWDGDGSIYIADRGGNAIYSFPSTMHSITPTDVAKVYSLEDPFGVAVYRPATSDSMGSQTFLGVVENIFSR